MLFLGKLAVAVHAADEEPENRADEGEEEAGEAGAAAAERRLNSLVFAYQSLFFRASFT